MLDSPAAPLRSWAEIDLSALRQNYAFTQSLHPGASIMGVVKANAYGHGIRRVSRELESLGATFLGVANCGEARRISESGGNSLMYILGPTFPDERPEIVANGWRPCLSSDVEARAFNTLAEEAGKVLAVHLALDTGMGRGGYLPEQLDAAVNTVESFPHLRLEGIGSHLPSADEDPEFTRAQIAVFESLVASHRALPFIHLANSAGTLAYDVPSCNLVRPGLMLYGASPIPAYQAQLTPVMSLKSRVSVVRTLPAGHGISYGRQTILQRETSVATIGLGYGDGYPRAISGKGAHVFIKGQHLPLLGRVTMDQIMVDVTDAPEILSGDEVELFGKNIPVTQVAEWADTIAWEIFTGITPRVTRVEISGEN